MKKVISLVVIGTIMFAAQTCNEWYKKMRQKYHIVGTKAGIVMDKDGTWQKIFAKGSAAIDFADEDEKEDALMEAEMKAKAQIAKFLKEQNKIFILDESFVDFSTLGEQNSLISQEIIDNFENLIIIKSISKSYGVPGVRLGVMVTSNQEILQKAKEVLSIWNINSFGEFFLQIIGKYQKDYKIACQKIAKERDRFYKRLQKFDFLKVYNSQANYFLVELKGIKATKFCEDLLWEKDIFIKDLTGKKGFVNGEFIRIAVRDYKDNEFLIKTLEQL